MIHPEFEVGLRKQFELFAIPKSSYYYRKKCLSAKIKREELIMNDVEKIYKRNPTYGIRRMTAALKRNGLNVNHKRVHRFYKKFGIHAIYPKKKLNTSLPDKGHKRYKYLLRNMLIIRPNQVWSTDITYLQGNNGKAYLVAIIDWFSRKILSWRIMNTMDTYYCAETLRDAIKSYGKPEFFNTDQGSQFTSKEFLDVLRDNDIKISMDGKGRCRDNARIERFWHTIKLECFDLNCYGTMNEFKQGARQYFRYYNSERLHSALNYATPDEAYSVISHCLTKGTPVNIPTGNLTSGKTGGTLCNGL